MNFGGIQVFILQQVGNILRYLEVTEYQVGNLIEFKTQSSLYGTCNFSVNFRLFEIMKSKEVSMNALAKRTPEFGGQPGSPRT